MRSRELDHLGLTTTMTDYPEYRTDDKTMPAVCYGLYFLGFATAGLTSVVGVIMAYAQRGLASEAAWTHYTFMIRTFWLGLVWMFLAGMLMGVGIPLSFILIGIPLVILAKLMFGLGAVWYGLRLVLGVVHLSRDEPYPRPYAVLA
jgi:uncharacterized membrane protein